ATGPRWQSSGRRILRRSTRSTGRSARPASCSRVSRPSNWSLSRSSPRSRRRSAASMWRSKRSLPRRRSTLADRQRTMARAKAPGPTDTSVVEVDEITLDGKRVVVRNQDIPVELLRLDPKNPRIANTVNLQSRPKAASLDSVIEELLWNDPDVRDLYRQVLVNGGLIER